MDRCPLGDSIGKPLLRCAVHDVPTRAWATTALVLGAEGRRETLSFGSRLACRLLLAYGTRRSFNFASHGIIPALGAENDISHVMTQTVDGGVCEQEECLEGRNVETIHPSTTRLTCLSGSRSASSRTPSGH